MARTTCPLCDKTFRNPSGLSWHMTHIHPPTATAGMVVSLAMDPIATEQAWLEGGGPSSQDKLDTRELSVQLGELEDRLETAHAPSLDDDGWCVGESAGWIRVVQLAGFSPTMGAPISPATAFLLAIATGLLARMMIALPLVVGALLIHSASRPDKGPHS